MPVILCEGPDGAGKSTLARQCFSDYEYIHNGVFPTPIDAYNAYVEQISRMTPESKVFIDRQHISERIYGMVYHGVNMDDDQYYHIDSMLADIGAVVVLCLPKYETALGNWSSRLEDELINDVDAFHRIYQQYEAMMFSSRFSRWLTKLPVILYDYENPIDLKEVLR